MELQIGFLVEFDKNSFFSSSSSFFSTTREDIEQTIQDLVLFENCKVSDQGILTYILDSLINMGEKETAFIPIQNEDGITDHIKITRYRIRK